MDSFYEQPRTINRSAAFEQYCPNPVVPEVSMIFQKDIPAETPVSADSMLLTYKAWKEHNNVKTNTTHSNQSDFLKRVRFDGQMQSSAPNRNYETNVKSLEQLYLANIPNRHLDISVIDSPRKRSIRRNENIENVNPNICEPVKPDSKIISNPKLEVANINDTKPAQNKKILDMYNYKCGNFASYKVGEKLLSEQYIRDELQSGTQRYSDCNCGQKQSSETTVVDKGSKEPCTVDLLKIIQQQNEQLIVLQRQVASLLNTKDMPKQIQAPKYEKYQTSTQIEKPNVPLKRPMQQFSLDVMTSFEVSIRRQQNHKPYKDTYQSKITEITETSSGASLENDPRIGNKIQSGAFDPIPSKNARIIGSESPAPNNVIDIDMKDYSSDESSDDEGTESTNVGWTFYNNIMGQVNEIFKKSGIRPFPVNDTPPAPIEISENLLKHNIMKKVKEATAKHLKSIGVHVPTMDISDEPLECSPNNPDPNEISYAVKQLLMKYLPDEQLAKVPLLQEQKIRQRGSPGLIQRRPEFSLATLQYMQKYNLLNDDNPKVHQVMQAQALNKPSTNFERILDITAIRQQPKLL